MNELIQVAAVAVLAALVVAAIRWRLRTTTTMPHPGRGSLPGNDADVARVMLREQLDRGEIDAAEFETRTTGLGR